ncbi:MAG: guanylate kinase [Lachnospiraceae bacterium]|nr:guanylate kinase [Lachnospiraceae bacterium]
MKDRKGIMAILSGFSGVGKGTIVGELVERYGYMISISATTRAPRDGEKEGVNYFFKTMEEFEQMIEREELIEYARYVDNYYGTPKEYVLEQLEEGRDVLLEIEMQGALKIKERFPEVALIFIVPPNVSDLKKRLIKRGTENEEMIRTRIARSKEECQYLTQYDYIVVNDDLEECIEEIHGILEAVHDTRENQRGHIEKIKEEFETFHI